MHDANPGLAGTAAFVDDKRGAMQRRCICTPQCLARRDALRQWMPLARSGCSLVGWLLMITASCRNGSTPSNTTMRDSPMRTRGEAGMTST